MDEFVCCGFLVILIATVSGVNFTFNGYGIDIGEDDGALTLTRPDKLQIQIKLLEIQEKDLHGNMIQISGHSVRDALSDQNITVNQVCSRMMPFSNVNARYVNVKSNAYSDDQKVGLGYDVYHVTSPGHLVLNTEVQRLDANNVRLGIHVDGWRFCDQCQGEDGDSATGESLDLLLQLTLPPGGDIQLADVENGPREVTLGNNMAVYLPTQVWRDGEWEDIGEDYLTLAPNAIHLRVPKFQTAALYTMVFDLGPVDDTATEPVEEDDPSVVQKCTEKTVRKLSTDTAAGVVANMLVIAMLALITLILH